MSAGLLRRLKSRIRSVDNTKKITRAMEMVSAAKLRRFQKLMTEAKPYTHELEAMLVRLVRDQTEARSAPTELTRRQSLPPARAEASQQKSEKNRNYSHPFFEERPEKHLGLVLLTSDSGLCGAYNTELIELVRKTINRHSTQTASLASSHSPTQKPSDKSSFCLFGVGKMGVSALKKSGYAFERTFTEIKVHQVESTIKTLKADLETAYLQGKVDAVYVIYSHFISATASKAVAEKILPLKRPQTGEHAAGKSKANVPYIYEPTPEFIFEKLIPVFFEAKIRMIFLEAFVSEHMARMNAMHQATKNAREMIDSLTLTRNKVRQAIITKEIIEIVSGSRALKT